MSVSQIQFYNSELKDWDKSLDFYNYEMKLLKDRLVQVADRNTKSVVLQSVEHFQNQLIVQEEQFDLLLHDIHEQQKKVRSDLMFEDARINVMALQTQHVLRDKVQMAEKIFVETKHDFYRFLAHVL